MSPRGSLVVMLAMLVIAAEVVHAASDLTSDQALPRVQHHVQEADGVGRHFRSVLDAGCRRFGSPDEWRSYFNAEVDRVVLMLAHIEQAWVEAKRTGDDDVRRTAKASRKRLDDARALVDKMQGCAGENGASFGPMQVWRKVEREVPRRQAEIALPDVPGASAPTSAAPPAATPASR
jgi:hypothetical protein